MIVHRDYRESSASIIKIFDDKIEFFNPGRLYGGITIDDLLSGKYISQSRNKLIAKSFKEAGLIERYGSGIMRVFRICREYGIKEPSFTLFKEKLKISIEKPKDEGLKLIIQSIAKKPGIQARELSELLNDRSLKTIERQISQLIGRNYIERKGSKKTGGYFLKD